MNFSSKTLLLTTVISGALALSGAAAVNAQNTKAMKPVKTDAAAKTTATASSGYKLLTKIQVGGEGGWDYLLTDSAARRLYVSHATKVNVIDLDSNKVIGEIADTSGVHGIAVAAEFGTGYTSNGKTDNVTVFDSKTLKTIKQIAVGKNPDCIIYDAATRRVFTFNGRSNDATAIDAKTETVVGTLALGGRPEFAVSDGNGKIFVNLEDKNQIVAFDAKTLKILSTVPLAPGEEPTGLAYDAKSKRLFAGCGNKKMIVVNAENGKVVGDVPVGEGVDATAFDPTTKLAFASAREGILTVVREEAADKFSVLDNVTTQRGAKTMAVDAKTHNVYLATAQFGDAPAATPDNPRPRPAIVPNSFVILVFGR